jgi:hypothetical protein
MSTECSIHSPFFSRQYFRRDYFTVLAYTLQALNNLAMNDDNKLHIIECGGLPYYVQVFQLHLSADEQLAAIQCIRKLASRFKDRILQHQNCVEGTVTKKLDMQLMLAWQPF